MTVNEIDMNFLGLFLEEAKDILANWERACLDLEKGFDKATCDALFRAAHNLKGSSLSVGLNDFGAFVHRVEDVITLVKNGVVEITPEVIKAFLAAQSTMLAWIEKLGEEPAYVPASELARVNSQVAALTACEMPVKKEAPAEPAERKLGEVLVDEGLISREVLDKALAVQEKERPQAAAKAEETIRVAASKVDELLQLLGELSIQQSILAHAQRAGNLHSEITSRAILSLGKISKEIQHQALALRMQELKGTFQRLERTARDVARTIDKKINVILSGGDVELDKTVTERMIDPLTHIIRNAVDHGIESPAERATKGKNEVASLTIHAASDVGGVVIRVTDDGRGIDAEKIFKKAVEKGLVDKAAKMSEREMIRLIMLPGFSTAEKVTDISGRGVGMDVVQRTIEEIGGSLEIDTVKGQGTIFSISVPASLSIVDALIVDVQNVHYAVPLMDIAEIIDMNEYPLTQSNHAGQIISLRGKVIPVERLGKYLPTERSPAKQNLAPQNGTALLARSGDQLVGFVVDRLVSQQSVVVKKLKGSLAELPNIGGGTILGSGDPGMIVSLPSVVRNYLARGQRGERLHA